MFDIKEFRAYISETGYVPKNRYYVNIPIPPVMLRSNISVKGTSGELNGKRILEDLQFRAESVTIPGVTVNVTPVNRYGIGPQQRFGVNAQFSDISMQFLLDREKLVWMFFYQWINNVFSFNQEEPTNIAKDNNYYSYRTSYHVDYAVPITVFVYDYSGSAESATTIEILEAFPVSIEPIGVGWSENDSLIKVSVKFSFRDWRIVDTATSDNAIKAPGPMPLMIPKNKDLQSYIFKVLKGIV